MGVTLVSRISRPCAEPLAVPTPPAVPIPNPHRTDSGPFALVQRQPTPSRRRPFPNVLIVHLGCEVGHKPTVPALRCWSGRRPARGPYGDRAATPQRKRLFPRPPE